MPRRQQSRSSESHAAQDDSQLRTNGDSQPEQQHEPASSGRNLDKILGGDPQFADVFFGEPANMPRKLLPATYRHSGGEPDGDVEMGASDRQNANEVNTAPSNGLVDRTVSDNGPVPRNNGTSGITIENTPHDIDHLIIRQLIEDLDAYRYDLDFCRTQLDPEVVDTVTPHEARTFQLRILDIGHQMRMLHHRIQLMQATMTNARHVAGMAGRAGAATANAYYGAYPPGTSVTPGAYSGNTQGYNAAAIANGQYGGIPIQPYQTPGGYGYGYGYGYGGYGEPPQERRGPGRPVGSKNRPRPAGDPNVSSVAAVGSAKAAALASAGAKRELPNEIRVATPDHNEAAAAAPSTGERPAKRPKHDVQVGSPLSNTTEDEQMVPTGSRLLSSTAYNGADRDATQDENDLSTSIAVANTAKRSTPSVLAAPAGTPPTPSVPAIQSGLARSPPSSAGPATTPRGGPAYTRLGHWMCTLCTSQKYLQHPAPKQPSEPSSWPLRDISKMITHLTRMHAEHNNAERCMELGNALAGNRGPFRYWVQVTKKERASDVDIEACIAELLGGTLPEMLRRLSTAAAAFPRQH